MTTFTDEQKATIKTFVEDCMNSNSFLCGKYDAKHGNQDFELGIYATLEILASLVSEEYMNEFSEKFSKNMIDSEERV